MHESMLHSWEPAACMRVLLHAWEPAACMHGSPRHTKTHLCGTSGAAANEAGHSVAALPHAGCRWAASARWCWGAALGTSAASGRPAGSTRLLLLHGRAPKRLCCSCIEFLSVPKNRCWVPLKKRPAAAARDVATLLPAEHTRWSLTMLASICVRSWNVCLGGAVGRARPLKWASAEQSRVCESGRRCSRQAAATRDVWLQCSRRRRARDVRPAGDWLVGPAVASASALHGFQRSKGIAASRQS